MRMQVEDIIAQKVKDDQGRPCPVDVQAFLRETGVVSIGCKRGRFNWDVIRSDVENLIARFGRKVDGD